jgi:hypothetical protein
MIDWSKKRRFLEIMPGAAIWGSLIVLIGLSFVKPLWVVVFIIIVLAFQNHLFFHLSCRFLDSVPQSPQGELV